MNSLRFKEHPLKKIAPVPVMTNVRELRQAANFSQENAAERFNVSLRVWQTKETLKNPSPLSQGEYELLLLLADRHPHYTLQPHTKKQS
ncbi:transcriptional regulator [Erwinia sp. P7711]|uniref:transcriptional regulator n=1 Tax=Erwinia sp. P7711 TaxID=3141451 RepID=UPI003195DAD6